MTAENDQLDVRQAWLSEFGAVVGTARRSLGLTQRELSAKVGLDRASIANIEAGRQDTTGTTIARLVAILGLTVPGWTATENPLAERLVEVIAANKKMWHQIMAARAALEASDTLAVKR